jgi:hypothetical protein
MELEAYIINTCDHGVLISKGFYLSHNKGGNTIPFLSLCARLRFSAKFLHLMVT